jgi:hypothetical protein
MMATKKTGSTKNAGSATRQSAGSAAAAAKTQPPAERKSAGSRTGAAATAKAKPRKAGMQPIGEPDRQMRIEQIAYYKAEKRDFAPGRELEDWLEAEREVDEGSKARPSS